MHQSKSRDVLKLSTLALALAISGGCISAKINPGDAAAEAAPAAPAAPAAVVQAVEPVVEEETVEPTELISYAVVSGDSLWYISKQDQIYGTAYSWPLIYKANASQIKDADLIYPGQVFDIPRDVGQAAIDTAVNHAKMRGAWAVGPTESSDTAYLGG